jgi:hypothetical protein
VSTLSITPRQLLRQFSSWKKGKENMKKRFLLGALIAVVSSVLFAGTALAQVPNVVYPRGDSDPHAVTLTEWKVLPDGSVTFSGGATGRNGFSAAIVRAGTNGEPVVVTFDKEDDLNAYQTARGQEPLPSIKRPNADQRQALSIGDGHIGIGSAIRNPSGTNVNWSTFYHRLFVDWHAGNLLRETSI